MPVSKINRPDPPSPPDLEKDAVLTPPEVASQLRVSTRTVYRLLEAGTLPHYRVGRNYFVLKEKLKAWIAEGGSVSGVAQ